LIPYILTGGDYPLLLATECILILCFNTTAQWRRLDFVIVL